MILFIILTIISIFLIINGIVAIFSGYGEDMTRGYHEPDAFKKNNHCIGIFGIIILIVISVSTFI